MGLKHLSKKKVLLGKELKDKYELLSGHWLWGKSCHMHHIMFRVKHKQKQVNPANYLHAARVLLNKLVVLQLLKLLAFSFNLTQRLKTMCIRVCHHVFYYIIVTVILYLLISSIKFAFLKR